jgi:hypothetical protein
MQKTDQSTQDYLAIYQRIFLIKVLKQRCEYLHRIHCDEFFFYSTFYKFVLKMMRNIRFTEARI